MPYVTSTGELRDSQTPFTPGWFWSILLGIWNFIYLMFYTLFSPGYNKTDERDRQRRRGWGDGGAGGGGFDPRDGGGGGPRRRPIGRLAQGGPSSPQCPPMAGGG